MRRSASTTEPVAEPRYSHETPRLARTVHVERATAAEFRVRGRAPDVGAMMPAAHALRSLGCVHADPDARFRRVRRRNRILRQSAWRRRPLRVGPAWQA